MTETSRPTVEGAENFKMPDDGSKEDLETTGKISDLLPIVAEKLKSFGATEANIKRSLVGKIVNSYFKSGPRVSDPFLDGATFKDLIINAETGLASFHLTYQFKGKTNERNCELSFKKLTHNEQEITTPYWSIGSTFTARLGNLERL